MTHSLTHSPLRTVATPSAAPSRPAARDRTARWLGLAGGLGILSLASLRAACRLGGVPDDGGSDGDAKGSPIASLRGASRAHIEVKRRSRSSVWLGLTTPQTIKHRFVPCRHHNYVGYPCQHLREEHGLDRSL